MAAIITCKDADALAVRATDLIVQSAREAVGRRRRFTLVLTGGSTPEKTYRLLAQPEHSTAIDWSRTCLFFSDERFVPPDDNRSNFSMIKRILLSHPAVQSARVYPMNTQGKSAGECAAEYARELARFFSPGVGTAPPRFDLILLGLGEDGHVASLFPGAMALLVEHEWVTWSPPGTLPPAVNRITLTYPVLNAARQVAFLVSGAKKAPALRDILEKKPARDVRPAAGIQPTEGAVTWLVDEDAAALLTRNS
jgi:6-phosphogluconolactonase